MKKFELDQFSSIELNLEEAISIKGGIAAQTSTSGTSSSSSVKDPDDNGTDSDGGPAEVE